MSYCRWSSDWFRCDLYIYEYCSGGWTTHVAGNRRVGLEPPQDAMDAPAGQGDEAWATYFKQQREFWEYLDTLESAPICLPHDGQSFNDPTAAACADRAELLRSLGYNVPQYAIDSLREEAAETEAKS